MGGRGGAAGSWNGGAGRDGAVRVQAGPDVPDEQIVLPSGQTVTLQDVVWNVPGPEGLTSRFRFIAPAIAASGGTVDFETAAADMLWLCQNYALPRVADPGPQPSQIVISLSDIPVPFGEANPVATQFFEAYTLEDGACQWSVF
jgi:hypothetical protein